MKRLWAPWRMEYIRSEDEAGCFLCRAASGPDDQATLVVKRGKLCLALLNRYPYNNGHLMVAPFRHVGTLDALSPEERAEMMDMTAAATRVLQAVMHAEGFNVGLNLGAAAGAGLEDHIHLHIVPRWTGDTNFMPVLGETKVIPQALADLHAEVSRAWASF